MLPSLGSRFHTFEGRGMRNAIRVMIALAGGLVVAGAFFLMTRDSRTGQPEGRTSLREQNITVSEGEPPIYTIKLPSGVSVQAFVQPRTPGADEVHLTFLTESGAPQPVDISRFEALRTAENPVPLQAVELAPGHFVAQQDLSAGSWRFLIEGSTPQGTQLRAYFEENIEE